jgi:hypothetical protein
MEKVSIIGLDLAKRRFQMHGARADGGVAFRTYGLPMRVVTSSRSNQETFAPNAFHSSWKRRARASVASVCAG